MQMKITSAFSSKFLKASDIPEDRPVVVRIDRVEIEDVGGKGQQEHKPVLYFIGKEKGMVLNKTNSKVVANAYGDETDDWHGKSVQIYATEVEFQGDMVAALRLRIPNKTTNNNGGGQGAPVTMAGRREQTRNQPPAENPVSEDQAFEDADIPF
jgi:hypothetical protein